MILQWHKTSRVSTGVREISVTRIGTKNECQDGELRDNEVIPWYAKYR